MAPIARFRELLESRVDAASLGAFRILFGALMVLAVVRFWAMGWIDELYVRPSFHFTFWGFEWVRPWPGVGMYLHFALLAVCAALVTLGLFYRVAIVIFTIAFAYLELIDATYYLNHYYAIVLFGALLAVLPADRALSVRAALGGRGRERTGPRDVPFAAVFVLRAQLAIVYFFAGLAKVNEDWLRHAEPLRTWLLARTDVPILGGLLDHVETAYAMSWAGAIFDLTIPIWLSWRRTRPYAYLVVIGFHVATAALFRIGMFPWVMIALTPIFFSPGWPRRIGRSIGWPRRIARAEAVIEGPPRALPRVAYGALGAWLAVQIAMPLRHHLVPGDLLWTGEGMRWSWHVMIAERAGWAELRAIDEDGRTWTIDPSRELTPLQARMMAVEPDLLLQYAHHVRDDFARRGHRVEVHADVWVSANGRRSQRLVDPEVDLASERETLRGYAWLLDAPRQ